MHSQSLKPSLQHPPTLLQEAAAFQDMELLGQQAAESHPGHPTTAPRSGTDTAPSNGQLHKLPSLTSHAPTNRPSWKDVLLPAYILKPSSSSSKRLTASQLFLACPSQGVFFSSLPAGLSHPALGVCSESCVLAISV